MSDAGTTPPPLPESGADKKGLSPLAWIAIGIGTFVAVGFAGCLALGVFVFRTGQEAVREATGSESLSDFVEGLRGDPARTAAEAIIRINPELDLISTDDDAGTITFRNTRTDEEATLNFADGNSSWGAAEAGASGRSSPMNATMRAACMRVTPCKVRSASQLKVVLRVLLQELPSRLEFIDSMHFHRRPSLGEPAPSLPHLFGSSRQNP